MMGIINRTPDSFSDRGNSLDESFFKNQLSSFLKTQSLILDIGFESTAPMNKAISLEEEWRRFELFLEATKDFQFNSRQVSFDTYKIENFLKMKEAFLKIHPKVSLILNDVSGVLDKDLMNLISSHKNQKLTYIYTFTHIPSRDLVLKHMEYVHRDKSNSVLERCLKAFKDASTFYKKYDENVQLILDPGFGFSKSYDENWTLIDHFSLLLDGLEKEGLDHSLLIGLSKKSFLKKFCQTENTQTIENLHKQILQKMINENKFNRKLIFRAHDPQILGDF